MKKALIILCVITTVLAIALGGKGAFHTIATVINHMAHPTEELLLEVNSPIEKKTEQQETKKQTAGAATSVLFSEIFSGTNSFPPFIEIYNNSNSVVDLTNFSIRKRVTSGDETTFVAKQRFNNVSISPHRYLLIAKASSTLPADIYWPKSYNIPKSNGILTLYNAEGEKTDEVSWTSTESGASLVRITWDEKNFALISIPTPQGSANPNFSHL